MKAALALIAAAALALAPAGGAAGAPVVSKHEIESEVMCPVCGTLLELAESPQAKREKAFVSRLIAAGKTKEEIKDALVVEYGEEVLALPSGSGFNLSAYVVPIVAFAVAAVALALGVARWRRAGRGREDEDSPAAASGPSDEDSARLDADLAKYDL